MIDNAWENRRIATALVAVGLVLAMAVLLQGKAQSSAPVGEALSEQFGELSTGGDAVASYMATAMQGGELDFARSAQVGQGLPGEHAIGLTDAGAAGPHSAESVCIAGRLAGDYGGIHQYGTCQDWELIAEHGLFYQASSKEGFAFVALVPGGQGSSLHFQPTDPEYTGAEALADRGLVLMRGPAPATDNEVLGTLTVERPDGATFRFDVANPGVDVE